MNRTEHVVLWDGRRNGPGGAYLAHPQPSAPKPSVTPFVDAPVAPVTVTPCGIKVFESLKAHGQQTMRDLAFEIDASISVVNAALYQLRRRGVVKVVGSRELPGSYRQGYGRKGEAIYALVVGGAR